VLLLLLLLAAIAILAADVRDDVVLAVAMVL
jgi:hypothetical protein